MFDLHMLTGFKIKTIRGFRETISWNGKRTKRKKDFAVRYILFTDKKTFIELDDQDYHTYHDCSSSAKDINIRQDKKKWKRIFEDTYSYPIADKGISY